MCIYLIERQYLRNPLQMKKTIFTYSRKRPTTTLTVSSDAQFTNEKRPRLAIEEWENLQNLEANVTIRRPGNSLAVKAPSTPTTQLHNKNIKETLDMADRKLKLLSSLSVNSAVTSTTSQHSAYKKLLRLALSSGHEVGIPDLLSVLGQADSGVLSFEDWIRSKSSDCNLIKIGEATFSEVFCFDADEVVKIIPLQLDKPVNEGNL